MSASSAPTASPALPSSGSRIEIRALQPGDDATAFRTLNEEWIARYFTLEARDIETLGDPETTILRKGGSVFMAYADKIVFRLAASHSFP